MANSWSACCLARLVIIHGKQKSFTSLAEFCTFSDEYCHTYIYYSKYQYFDNPVAHHSVVLCYDHCRHGFGIATLTHQIRQCCLHS